MIEDVIYSLGKQVITLRYVFATVTDFETGQQSELKQDVIIKRAVRLPKKGISIYNKLLNQSSNLGYGGELLKETFQVAFPKRLLLKYKDSDFFRIGDVTIPMKEVGVLKYQTYYKYTEDSKHYISNGLDVWESDTEYGDYVGLQPATLYKGTDLQVNDTPMKILKVIIRGEEYNVLNIDEEYDDGVLLTLEALR